MVVGQDWHQKLHNNTTPDDVAICDAFIRFLERGGDMGAYWATLSDYGMRLQHHVPTASHAAIV